MKYHTRLLTVLLVGLTGVTTAKAADDSYGGAGPWSPGYGTPGGFEPPTYGRRDRETTPSGSGLYDAVPPPTYPTAVDSSPWVRGGERGYGPGYDTSPGYSRGQSYGPPPGYGGPPPSYRGPGYGGGPGYGPAYGGGPSRSGGRMGFSWGNRGSGAGAEPGYGRAYNAPRGESNYGGRYGSPPDAGSPSYGPNYNGPNARSGYEGRVPPTGRYDRDGRGYEYSDRGAPGMGSSWGEEGNAYGSSETSATPPGYTGGKGGYEEPYRNSDLGRLGQGASPGGNDSSYGADGQGKKFAPETSKASSDSSGYSPWNPPDESGTGLIPSPSGGLPAGAVADKNPRKSTVEEQEK